MEKAKRLPITYNTQRLLFHKSGNLCAFPNCSIEIINKNDRLKGQICHIEVAMPKGGERFNSKMTNEERRSYENLIFLCFNHHEETNNVSIYTVPALLEMKSNHELLISKSRGLANKFLDHLDSTSENQSLDELNERAEKAFELLNKQENFLLLQRLEYPKPINYIKRNVYSLQQSGSAFQETHDLIDLVKNERLITILGIAGSGKSIELNYLAYHYSEVEQNGFFPIKVRLNLFTKNCNVKKLISNEFKDFENNKNQELLIILDALDEVNSDYLGEAVIDIINFQKEFPNSTIVVSCRNNFYTVENKSNSARLEGFKTFRLNRLSDYDVEVYSNEILDRKSSEFLEQVSTTKLKEQLKSPFYLVQLVEHFHDFHEIPSSKTEIFELIINKRIERDKTEKYQNLGLRVADYQNEIIREIQKIAICAESLGRNYLLEEEYQNIVERPVLKQLINYTFLIDKNKTGHWEFEHNNFQEYLAAQHLSKLSVKHIKKFISFPKSYKKVKPSWVNTLSFLLSILYPEKKKYNTLIKWVQKIEADLLIRFEKDKIDIKIREQIFENIYEDFETKKIVIRNEKFDEYELAEFVSDSPKILNFLLSKISDFNTEYWKISEAARMISHFDATNKDEENIIQAALSAFKNQNLPNETKFYCFFPLSSLKIFTQELTTEILKIIDLDSSNYLRAGFYNYLRNADNIDEYEEILMKGISFIEKPKVHRNRNNESDDSGEPRLSVERYNLEDLFKKLPTYNLTKSLLERESNEYDYESFNIDLLKIALFNAKELSKKNVAFDFYDTVFKLLISLSRKYSTELDREIHNFFSETKNSTKAFTQLREMSNELENTDMDYYNAIGVIVDKSCVSLLLQEFKAGNLTNNAVINYRTLLNWARKEELHSLFFDKINKFSGNKFLYKEVVSYEEKRMNQLHSSFTLLMNKNSFIEKMLKIFRFNKIDKLDKKILSDFTREYHNDDDIYDNIIMRTLRQEVNEKEIILKEEIENFYQDEIDWFWFQTHKIVDIDFRNPDFELSEIELVFFKDWLQNALKESDFNTTIYFDKDNQIQRRYLEHYIPYFAYRTNTALDDELYLNFFRLV